MSPLHDSYTSRPVLVFGEVLADIFPDRFVLGGAPFNVACHLAGFGLNPLFITCAGQDSLQEELMQRMVRFGMETEGVQIDPAHATGQAEVSLNGAGGHSFTIKADQAYDYIDADQALDVALRHEPQLFYFGTLAQRSPVSRAAWRALQAQLTCPGLSDINLRHPWTTLEIAKEVLAAADVVKMNLEELQHFAHELHLPGSSPEAWAEALGERFTIQQILVTCGADGAWQWRADGEILTAPAAKDEAPMLDTIGAGDAFTAVLILGLVHRWPHQLSLVRANAFARAICSIRGAIPEHTAFYASFLEKWHGKHDKTD